MGLLLVARHAAKGRDGEAVAARSVRTSVTLDRYADHLE